MSEPFWAVVELMGHVRMAGLLSEEERFGVKMGRLDVPKGPDAACVLCGGSGSKPPAVVGQPAPPCDAECCTTGFTTTFFGGQSVYRITPCTEAAALAVAKSNQPSPVHSWELPKALPAPARTGGNGDFEDYDDEDEL